MTDEAAPNRQSKRRRRWRVAGALFLGLVTLLAAALVVENIRGKRAFLKYRRQLEARGETLEWQKLLPRQVPDEENFARTPLLAPLYAYRVHPVTGYAEPTQPEQVARIQSLFGWTSGLSRPSWRAGECASLEKWQESLRSPSRSLSPALTSLQAKAPGTPAEDILFLVNELKPEMEELRGASKRPHTRLPLGAEAAPVLLPALALVKAATAAFQCKALAELAQGRPEAAAEDVEVCLRISAALGEQPQLLVTLVRIALLDVAIQPLWEGIARHQWSSDQLQRFQQHFATQNLVREMHLAIQGERAFSISAVTSMKRNPAIAGADGTPGGPWTGALRFWPAGWVYQNQRQIGLGLDRLLQEALFPEEKRVDLARADFAQADFQKQTSAFPLYSIFARMLLPAIAKTPLAAARAQTTAELALTACALERFFLQNQTYPEDLSSLLPAFLDRMPHDVCTGDPLLYRRVAPDHCLIYSRGQDGRDDGGITSRSEGGSVDWSRPGSDWVWALHACPANRDANP